MQPLRAIVERKSRVEGEVNKKPTLMKDDVSKIFSNIEIIYNFHLQFLGEIEVSIPSIGSTFKKWVCSINFFFFFGFLFI